MANSNPGNRGAVNLLIDAINVLRADNARKDKRPPPKRIVDLEAGRFIDEESESEGEKNDR
jgi:hypothetical protein